MLRFLRETVHLHLHNRRPKRAHKPINVSWTDAQESRPSGSVHPLCNHAYSGGVRHLRESPRFCSFSLTPILSQWCIPVGTKTFIKLLKITGIPCAEPYNNGCVELHRPFQVRRA